jgi:Kef-type K+ transport system membrane component KefB
LRRAAGLASRDAWPLAAVLIPRAEISLIIAQYGITIGLTPAGIAQDILAVAMTVMIGTALLPAAVLEFAKRRAAAAEAAA